MPKKHKSAENLLASLAKSYIKFPSQACFCVVSWEHYCCTEVLKKRERGVANSSENRLNKGSVRLRQNGHFPMHITQKMIKRINKHVSEHLNAACFTKEFASMN